MSRIHILQFPKHNHGAIQIVELLFYQSDFQTPHSSNGLCHCPETDALNLIPRSIHRDGLWRARGAIGDRDRGSLRARSRRRKVSMDRAIRPRGKA